MLLLTRQERADLFAQHLCVNDKKDIKNKVLVFAPSRLLGIGDFPGSIEAATASALGFTLDFVILRSPEYLYHNSRRRTVWSTRFAGREQSLLLSTAGASGETAFSSTQIRRIIYWTDGGYDRADLVEQLRGVGTKSVETLAAVMVAKNWFMGASA